jgi:hypothetical protein
MSYINFPALTKNHRVSQINTDLSTAAYLLLYSGTQPGSPDNTVSSGTLLAALPCSNPAGVVSYGVQTASVNAGGTGGTTGTQTVTGTTGTGTKFQASVTVTAGAISAVLSVTVAGSYSVLPTLNGEPVTGASLSGATLNLALTAVLTFSAITTENASATGTAGFARFATANTAGGAGIVDLDVATSGASVTINTTSIVSGGPVVVSAATLTEA